MSFNDDDTSATRTAALRARYLSPERTFEFTQGARHYWRGCTVNDNPYSRDYTKFVDWHDGFLMALYDL